MDKTAILFTFLLLSTTLTSGQQTQEMGLAQKVNINIERGDHGVVKTSKLYCMQKDISYCRDNTSIIDAATVVLDITEEYQNFLNALPWTQSQKDKDVIMIRPTD